MTHSKQATGLGLLAVALTAGFVWLGIWQLDRAEQNRALDRGFRQAAGLRALDHPIEAGQLGVQRYRRIELRGRFLSGHQILLDNLTHAGQAGFQVLTPYDIGEERLVLVNRGWVPAAGDRSQMPDVGLAGSTAAVAGRIDGLPRAALALDADPVTIDGVTVMSFPDYAGIESVLGRPVYPFQVLLDADRPDGFVRDWAPADGRAERNIAYAVQWFGLAALIVIIAAVLAFRQLRELRGRAA